MQGSVDQACLELAAAQHWLITRDQALRLGLSRHALDRRRRSGLLVPMFAGIYRVGAAPESWLQHLLAACLWVPGVASHRSALRLLGIEGYSGEILEVMTTAHRVSNERVRIHHVPSMPVGDVIRVGPIPTTNPTRTLLDVGSALAQKNLEEALDSALRQRLTSVDRLRAGVDRLGGRGSRGPGALGKLLDARGDVVPTDSALETRLSRLLRRHHLPQPQRQVEVRDALRFIGRVDFAYPELKIAIEVQSHRWHSDWPARCSDMARLNRLQTLGWIIIQITYEDLKGHPAAVAGRIREALDLRVSI
jgi:very-short-patch-repair endonuclease